MDTDHKAAVGLRDRHSVSGLVLVDELVDTEGRSWYFVDFHVRVPLGVHSLEGGQGGDGRCLVT